MKKLSLPILAALALALALAAPAGAIGVAPTVTISAPANNSVASSPPSLTFTTTGTAVEKTCMLTGPGVEEYSEPCASPYKPLATLPEGTYTYSVSANNTSGSDAKSVSFKIDTTKPSLAITAGPAEGSWLNINGVSFTATATDANPSNISCRIDDGLWGGCENATATTGTLTFNNITEGSHRFWFAATDKAGNEWTIFRQVNIDKTAPTASIAITSPSTDTNDNSPAFVLTSGDNYGVANRKCRIIGVDDPAVPCNGSTWLHSDPIADGSHTVEFVVTDNAGNVKTATQQFNLDSTLPTITYGGLEGDKTANTLPTIEFYVDDAHETIAKCAFDASDWNDLAVCGEGLHGPASPLSLGSHTFWISGTDSFGNTASAVYNFEVVAEIPGGNGGNGGSGGNGSGGGQGGSTPSVAVKAKSSKIKKGKFTLTVTVTASNVTSCKKAEVVIAPKVKKAKAFMVRASGKSKSGACVATAKVKLAAKFKSKKAKITAAQGATSKQITVKL